MKSVEVPCYTHFPVVPCKVVRDVALDRVISLESVELGYTCHAACRILPYLELPHLKLVTVSSHFRAGQTIKLANLLPHSGHIHLAGVTNMCYCSYSFFTHEPDCCERIHLFGGDTDVFITGICTGAHNIPTDWFSARSPIPFEQIEELKMYCTHLTSSFSFNRFKSLKILRSAVEDSERFLSLLRPDPRTGIPCPSLEEIQYGAHKESDIEYLGTLLEEKGMAGYLLERHNTFPALNQELGRELGKYVGEWKAGSPTESPLCLHNRCAFP